MGAQTGKTKNVYFCIFGLKIIILLNTLFWEMRHVCSLLGFHGPLVSNPVTSNPESKNPVA